MWAHEGPHAHFTIAFTGSRSERTRSRRSERKRLFSRRMLQCDITLPSKRISRAPAVRHGNIPWIEPLASASLRLASSMQANSFGAFDGISHADDVPWFRADVVQPIYAHPARTRSCARHTLPGGAVSAPRATLWCHRRTTAQLRSGGCGWSGRFRAFHYITDIVRSNSAGRAGESCGQRRLA